MSTYNLDHKRKYYLVNDNEENEEENEEVVNHLLENNPNAEILPITNLPIKTREGITEWNNKPLNPSLKNAKRIYHHDNDMEGFFLCKIKKTSEETKKTGENSI